MHSTSNTVRKESGGLSPPVATACRVLGQSVMWCRPVVPCIILPHAKEFVNVFRTSDRLDHLYPNLPVRDVVRDVVRDL